MKWYYNFYTVNLNCRMSCFQGFSILQTDDDITKYGLKRCRELKARFKNGLSFSHIYIFQQCLDIISNKQLQHRSILSWYQTCGNLESCQTGSFKGAARQRQLISNVYWNTRLNNGTRQNIKNLLYLKILFTHHQGQKNSKIEESYLSSILRVNEIWQ